MAVSDQERADFRKELEAMGLTKVRFLVKNLHQWHPSDWRHAAASEWIVFEEAEEVRRNELAEAQRHEREIQTAREANAIAARALTWSMWNTVIAVAAALIALAALFRD